MISLYSLPFSLLPHRFWRKVHVSPNGCWMWVGRLEKDGYARWKTNRRMALSHRSAYESLVGVIPEGLEIDHLCRVRHCVNPHHMEPVTHQTNVRRGMVPVIKWLAQVSKTHCPQGHPYNEANTYRWKDGRHCLSCRRHRALRSSRIRRGLPVDYPGDLRRSISVAH